MRLTAQRILAEHLREESVTDQHRTDPPSSRFWPDIRLDLGGATLINFNLKNVVMGDTDFGGATFGGTAMFDRATFSGNAWFDGATFSSDAWFGRATFSSGTRFGGAAFNGAAGFGRAAFSGAAGFRGATFKSDANFNEATFSGGADSLNFEQSRVVSSDAKHGWPTGWHLEPDGRGEYTVVRANDDSRS